MIFTVFQMKVRYFKKNLKNKVFKVRNKSLHWIQESIAKTEEKNSVNHS